MSPPSATSRLFFRWTLPGLLAGLALGGTGGWWLSWRQAGARRSAAVMAEGAAGSRMPPKEDPEAGLEWTAVMSNEGARKSSLEENGILVCAGEVPPSAWDLRLSLRVNVTNEAVRSVESEL